MSTGTIQVGTEKVGTRVYVTGNSYSIKSALKEAGCHWDGERKQWWIGAAKASQIAALVGKLDGQEAPAPEKKDLADRPCLGKVEYKGRTYYVIGRSEQTHKLWLTVLDCSIDFWALNELCTWVKRYEARQQFGGYGRGQVDVHQTIGGIRRFIASQKNPDTARVQCPECDAWHNATDRCRDCGGC